MQNLGDLPNRQKLVVVSLNCGRVWSLRDGNFAVHDLEIELIRDENSFIPRVFVGPDPGEGR
jgi:hypothetical protein